MKFNPEIHHRHSIRLKGYNYSTDGAYFVTICTYGKELWLKEKIIKEIIKYEWLQTADIRENVKIDEFVIMPNHFHGIIWIINVGATRYVAQRRARQLLALTIESNSLGTIIGQFKSKTTKRIRQSGFDYFKWQRNYYEYIIRNERDLYMIRKYVRENPINWDIYEENPFNKELVE